MAVVDATHVRGITSALARCPRQAAYAALGTEPEPPPVPMAEYFRRGQWFEMMRFAEIRERNGVAEVERHRLVHWQAAGREFTGQIDIYEKPTKTVVEVVSLVAPSQDMLAHKIEQARQYVILDPEAEKGRVDAINPSRLTVDESFPVIVRDKDRAALNDRIRQLEVALRTDGAEMPERCCQHPREAAGRLCSFKDTCFDGWVEPVIYLDGPELRLAAASAWETEQKRQELKRQLKAVDEERADRLAVLAELGVDGKAVLGDVEVTRTHVKGRTTFKYALAVKAGVIDETAVADFVTVGSPSERWSLSRIGDQALLTEEDFGDEPPF